MLTTLDNICSIHNAHIVISVQKRENIRHKRTKIKMSYMTYTIIMTNKQHVENHFSEMTYKQVQMVHSPMVLSLACSINCCCHRVTAVQG